MLKFLAIALILALTQAVSDEIFEAQKIADIVNSANTTWKAGVNFFNNVRTSYLKRLLGARKIPENERPPARLLDFAHDVPESFDGRTAWPECPSFSHVRDQGPCGSCWAIAGASALSDRMCVFTNGTRKHNLAGEQVLSCCKSCGDGCYGGHADKAWDYFHRTGLVTGGDYGSEEGCQPYSLEACEHHVVGPRPNCETLVPTTTTPSCQTKCTNSKYNMSFDQDIYKCGKVHSYDSVRDAQLSISKEGSIEASFLVFEDFFIYKSGVYHHTTGKFLGGHSIRILGWGTENGVDYWIAANSWNTDWGDKGFFKIKRGSNECGIEEDLVACSKQF